jgi:siroheme synthase
MGVSFIGTGPGDAGLITVKGKRLIEDADTVIYPGSSINPEILRVFGWKEDKQLGSDFRRSYSVHRRGSQQRKGGCETAQRGPFTLRGGI